MTTGPIQNGSGGPAFRPLRVYAWYPCDNGLTRGWNGSAYVVLARIAARARRVGLTLEGVHFDNPGQRHRDHPDDNPLKFDQMERCATSNDYTLRTLSDIYALRLVQKRIRRSFLGHGHGYDLWFYIGPPDADRIFETNYVARSIAFLLALHDFNPVLAIDGSAARDGIPDGTAIEERDDYPIHAQARELGVRRTCVEAWVHTESPFNTPDYLSFATYVAAKAAEARVPQIRTPLHVIWRDEKSERAYLSRNPDGTWNRGPDVTLRDACELAKRTNAAIHLNLDLLNDDELSLVASYQNTAVPDNPPVPVPEAA